MGIRQWYSEIVNCASKTCDEPKIGTEIGHFTQLSWKDSIKLGCGHAFAQHEYGEQIFIVCQYFPGGNVIRSDWWSGEKKMDTWDGHDGNSEFEEPMRR